MDETKRTFMKALTWQTMGLFVMTLIGYATTGSWRAAGGLAVTTFVVSLVTYMLHEKAWEKVTWGRRPVQGSDPR